jgi:UDP-glucose 4-epimerase
MKILVTGGAGYIGSHVVKLLIQQGFDVVVIDNLSQGHIKAITQPAEFRKVDLIDYQALKKIIEDDLPEAAIHFAAFAEVAESVKNPKKYYLNNVLGSINLLNALIECNIKKIVFSSTCSLYGNPLHVPISEKESIKPINPYAKTKFIIEQVMHDYNISFGLNYVALRYFNAAGASMDGVLGESHKPETHLIPLILQVALGIREQIQIYGNDYPTIDGTCIRDYIHVEDLAEAHIKALNYILAENNSLIVNLGTGTGNSVNEVINLAEEVTFKKIRRIIAERREGDPAVLVADNRKAKEKLNWSPKYDLKTIISSAWNWHQNPKY